MPRLILTTALGVLLAMPATATLPTSLPEAERAAVKRVEERFAGVKSMEARFEQLTSSGGRAEGTLRLIRPDRLRMDYTGKDPLLIIARDGDLLYYERNVNQVSYGNVSDTPAGILLRPGLSFQDPDLAVRDVRTGNGVVEITLRKADEPEAGEAVLYFKEEPFQLLAWKVTDTQNVTTLVQLKDIRVNEPLDEEPFRWQPPPGAQFSEPRAH